MPKTFLVKENSVNLFHNKFRPKEMQQHIQFDDDGRLGGKELFILNLPEMDGFETLTYEVTDFGRVTNKKIEETICYNIEKYDNLLLKLVKK